MDSAGVPAAGRPAATDAAAEAMETDVIRVLRITRMTIPPQTDLDALAAQLREHGAALAADLNTIPEAQRSARISGALLDWEGHDVHGPSAGAFDAWSRTRRLALIVRAMLRAVRDARAVRTLPQEAQASKRPPYTGEPIPLSFSMNMPW